MSITIQGYSDDIIDIIGDIEDELCIEDNDDESIVIISDGTVLRVQYDGLWKITVISKGRGKYIKEYNATTDDINTVAYSDVVTIEADIDWVALTKQLIKR